MVLLTAILTLSASLALSLAQASDNVGRDGTLGDSSSSLNDLLLQKAMRLEDYEAELIVSGGEPIRDKLGLDGSYGEEEEELSMPAFMRENTGFAHRRAANYYDDGDDGNDDYQAADDDDKANEQGDDYLNHQKYTFAGYSLKYASCQKVQRFSPEAVQRGEYSSMVTDDIVVLRLCPNNKCNPNYQYGCGSGFGEYVIDVAEYMVIIMKYRSQRQQNLCKFCSFCESIGYYSDGDDGDDGGYYGDDGRLLANSANCYQYSDECSYCSQNDDGLYGYGDIAYLDYLDYIGCNQVKNNGNGFYFNPYCDPNSNNIAMGAYYDNYCTQFAGDAIDPSDFTGVDFESDAFLNAPIIKCVECATSSYPPDYGAGNYFCNNIYEYSGKCDSYLNFEIGTNYDDGYNDDGGSNYYSNVTDEEVQCDFIESIRQGTYDSYGQIYMKSSQQSNQEGIVTTGQTVSLVVLSVICFGLALYSCFLHHEMTNLLLKSLSSGFLDSRRKQYRSRSRSKAQSYSATFSSDAETGDDDESTVASK